MKPIAFLFPGQGAQHVGMGHALAQSEPAARDVFDRAGEVLGWDVASLCFEGPEEELTRSDRAQPALFTVSAACLEVWRRRGGTEPTACAGLSSGEWTALHAGGVLGFEETLRALEARGHFMQEACQATPGAMLAVVGLDKKRVEELAARAGVTVANFNAPIQMVLSGPPEAIEHAATMAREAGARRAVRLQVAGAFHSPLMARAARRMADLLANITLAAPRCPVYSNVTAAPHEDTSSIRQRMVEQITAPVRWAPLIMSMRDNGIDRFAEVGAGRVLRGLMKHIDNTATIHMMHDGSSIEEVRSAIS